MAIDTPDDWQEQVRDMLRAQQETYIAAVKAWRDAAATAMSTGTAAPSSPPQPPPFSLPTATEVTEASYAFASKLLADQSRFLQALSKAMGSPDK